MFFKKITLTNFMGIPTRTIELSRNTSIFGRNGSGKTSMKEAIIYALTGSIYGTPQIDGAIHNGTDYLSVVLELEHDGKTYILERRRPLDSKSYSAIKMNGAEVKQEEITALFGTWEELVSGIVVGEFMAMEDIDEKFDLINKLVKGNPEKIYLGMVGAVVAEKYPWGSISEGEIISRVKSVNKEIESVSSKRMQVSARINEIGTPAQPVVTIDQGIIAVTKGQLTEHEKLRPLMGQSTMSNKDITDIDMVIRTLEVEKLKLVKPDPSELHKLKANLDMLKVQSDAIEHARVCQSCLRPFEEKDIQAQIDKKKVEMDEILARGGQLREEYNALSNAYEVGTSSLNTRIEELRARRMKTQNEITFANSGSVDDFNSRMKAWEHNKAEFLSKLGKEEQDYRDQQTGLQSYNNAVDRLNDLKKEDKELVKSLESHDLANLEIIKEALSPKGVTFKEIELKIVEIMKYFPEGFTIELLKKNKSNDEFKKVFNVSLDGVGYKWLSKGMKKLVDIRFANLISDKKGYEVLIIDDIEALTSAIAPSENIKQVITLCVKDAEFEVKNL